MAFESVPIGDIFTVAAGKTDRVSIRPPSGESWNVNGVAIEVAGAEAVLMYSKELATPDTYDDVEIAKGSESFVVSAERLVSSVLFLSIKNSSAAAVKVVFWGLRL